MGTRTQNYSERERGVALAALDANGGDVSATSRAVNVPRQTLTQWRDETRAPVPPEVRHAERERMALACERVAWRLLRRTNKKIKDMSGAQAALAFCQIVDKCLLLRGEATAITQHQDDERLAALQGIYGALRAAATALPPSAPAHPVPISLPDATTTPPPKPVAQDSAGQANANPDDVIPF